MLFIALVMYFFGFVAVTAASPVVIGPQVRNVQQRAHKVARAPVPIPTLAHLNPVTESILKRANPDEPWTFGGYNAKKKSGETTTMKALFNETVGSSWCNVIEDLNQGPTWDNWMMSAHVDSHVTWHNPEGPERPSEYVCFFYESTSNCDPSEGHAEYMESVPGKADERTFDAKYKYIHWGCQWHLDNKKSTPGGTGWP